MTVTQPVVEKPTFVSWSLIPAPTTPQKTGWVLPSLLKPLRNWLERIQIHDRKFAHFLCKWIPAQCPFERDIQLFGKTIGHIPPLCKLNPFYEEVTQLRFRALCYLADECGEDITSYC